MPVTSPTLTYAMKGRLTFSKSGWVILEIPNAIGNGLFQALNEHGVEQPLSGSTGQYNAHVSVIRPEEVESIGGPDKIKARGQTFGFNFGQVQEIPSPGGWAAVSKVWVIQIKSPELMKLRRSLGLGPPKYAFHMTFAIRKKNALVDKTASIIHFEKYAGSTEIRQSSIDGKGLFATRDFKDGDVIMPRFITRLQPKNGVDQWDQTEECRFTNHSPQPNCVIVRDGDYTKLVADRDITKGEELTGDYDKCESALGPNFDFTYQGKLYDGAGGKKETQDGTATTSTGEDYAGRRDTHPTSHSIITTLSGASESHDPDGGSVRANHNFYTRADFETGGACHSGYDASASQAHHSTNGHEAGSDRRGDTAGDHQRMGGLDTEHTGRNDNTGGADQWLERTNSTGEGPEPVHRDKRGASHANTTARSDPSDRNFWESLPSIIRSYCTATADTGSEISDGFVWGHTKQNSDGQLVNRNQPYGDKLRNLRKRRGECPGCGQPFKEDEPYPDVDMCEVCERFGPDKLIKEGMDLIQQIADARDATTEPKSDAQADAGNYAKGKFRMHGMQFTLENPKGSVRSGTDKNGTPWSSTMTADYGYINRTLGKDGDHVDAFIGPDPHAEMVFIVDQIDPASKKFDEHKCMFGYKTAADAEAAYFSNYSTGWQGMKSMTAMTIPQFKWWLKNGDQSRPAFGIMVKAALHQLSSLLEVA